jgi:hypothetical protein
MSDVDIATLYEQGVKIARSEGDAAYRAFLEKALAGKSIQAGNDVLDQLMAYADSASTIRRDNTVSTEIERLERELAAAKQRAKATFKPGELRAVVTADPAGRPVTRYEGHPDSCWDQFNPPHRYVRQFLTPGRRL